MVSFIFTNALDQFGIRKQIESYGSAPWLRIRLRVIERNLQFHPAEVRPAKTFRHAGASRFGLPSDVRGVFGTETCTHCVNRIATTVGYNIPTPYLPTM